MSEELKPCPCGKIPKELGIQDANQGGKWAYAICDHCGTWEIEFRTDYAPLDSPECKALAYNAWNYAPRSDGWVSVDSGKLPEDGHDE